MWLMSKCGAETNSRFMELKDFHGIEDERPSNAAAGPKKMSSGLICNDAISVSLCAVSLVISH